MKLDYVNESSVVGNFETNSFGVKVSSKMFKIFSSNIYKYPVRAVIREYCCNARDSHIEAKTTENYELHLPTKLDPIFSVRDYGTGLSHNDVRNTFTQYFYSTKESSNDYIGCLGLGSKSLFSIVDSFLVTSWYNGEKSVYTCYMDENGEPKIAHISTIQSSEKNGLKVEASVKEEDVSKFKQELNFVFKFMDRPICNFPFELKTPYDFHTDEYSLNYKSGQSYVVMGGVAYSLESGQIKNKELSNIVNHGVILYAPMGSVSFNPGREELSFDKETLKWIENALTFVKSDLDKQMQKKIDEKKSFFQAKVFVNSLSGLWKNIASGLMYSGKTLNSKVDLPKEVQFKVQDKATVIKKTDKAFYDELCKYILVRNGHMSACKNYARNLKYNTVFFITEDLIDIIGLCGDDYIDSDTLVSKTIINGKKTYVKKKIGGYLFSSSHKISYCYTSVDEVPKGSVYFIFNRADFTNDICSHDTLISIYNLLLDTHKIPLIYGVKTPPENGIHLLEWIKKNQQVRLLRPKDSKFGSYLMQTDKEYKNRYNKCKTAPYNFKQFPETIKNYIAHDEYLIKEEEKLSKTFPLIEEIGYGFNLTPSQVKLIKEVIDALPH